MHSENKEILDKQNKQLNTQLIDWICHYFKREGIYISFNLKL